MYYGFCTNIIVTSMLLLGGASVMNAASGMSVHAANFLIPIGTIFYTVTGGLKATFLASYIHTSIIFIGLVVFISYGTCDMIKPPYTLADADGNTVYSDQCDTL